MKNKLRLFFFNFLIFNCLTVSCSKDYTFMENSTKRYIWLYGLSATSNNSLFMENLKKLEITDVFLDINPERLYPSGSIKDIEYTKSLKSFLDLAVNENIKVHLMILDVADLIYTRNHYIAKNTVQNMLNFFVENPSYVLNPVVGIHYDIEPHTLDEWSSTDWRTNERLMKLYVSLLQKLYIQIKKSDLQIKEKLGKLTISAAIPAFWDEKAKTGQLKSGSPSVLKQYLDLLVVMAYLEPKMARRLSTKQKIETINNNCSGELSAANTVISINAVEFDSYDNIQDVYKQLYSLNKYNKFFYGICFFHYETFIDFYDN